MKTSDEIKTEIAHQRAIIERICDEATRENREINATEAKQVDSVHAVLPKLTDDLERTIRIESDRLATVASKMEPLLSRKTGRGVSRDGFVTLNRGDLASDAVGSIGVPNAMGHAIRAMILGPTKTTPQEIRNAMSENNNPAGGFLVPDQLSTEVIDLWRARSVLAQAGMRTMMQTTEDLHIARVTGDPDFGVYGENQTITESAMTFGLTTMSALKVATRITASRELVEDANNFVELVSQVLQSSIAAQIDYYGIVGGSGFNGLESRTDLHATTGIGAVDWLDLAAAAVAIRSANGEPGAAIMHPSIHDALLNAQSGDGVNASRGWLGAPPSLSNVQMLHTTNCTSTKIIVGDFTNLVSGIRQRPLVEISTNAGTAFETHSVQIKITSRIDFAVTRSAAFERLEGVTAS